MQVHTNSYKRDFAHRPRVLLFNGGKGSRLLELWLTRRLLHLRLRFRVALKLDLRAASPATNCLLLVFVFGGSSQPSAQPESFDSSEALK